MMSSKKSGFSKSYNSGVPKEVLSDNDQTKSAEPTEEPGVSKDIEVAENINQILDMN